MSRPVNENPFNLMSGRFRQIAQGLQLLSLLGPGWVRYRAAYAARKKLGLLKRRFPPVPWDAVGLDNLLSPGIPSASHAYHRYREKHAPPFLFPLGELPAADLLKATAGDGGVRRILHVADDYCRGRFLYYSYHVHELGWPAGWLKNPFTGGRHENETHWCDYPTFTPSLGDIKDAWEPSRFACAYWLARAYALTGDEKYPETFWGLFESWCRQNPPNRGPNWKCGQETAIRVFAWCFGLYGFWKSPATTDARVAAMVKAVALSARRIEGNIEYAVSQKNNHALSEAAGLMTVGLLFPELRDSMRWLRRGRAIFEREILRQIYLDGSYVQHSMNYHRVMLHDGLWIARLSDLNGEPLAPDVLDRIDRAGRFLHEMLDDAEGRVPNYGANDGALVLPLSACDYTDYRSTVQAARFLTGGRRVLPSGSWDETLLWLFGPDALEGVANPEPPRSSRFDAGGYYTLRGRDTWAMIRCHTYRDRPAHVDMLHVDLWYKGVNVFGDSGTYKYYCPESPALEKNFKDIRAHNSIKIGGRGPLELASRFLWTPWPAGRCHDFGPTRFVGEHDAYDRPPWNVLHRREVELLGDSSWIIRDELEGDGRHEVALRWHLPDVSYQWDEQEMRVALETAVGPVRIEISAPAGARLRMIRGDDSGPGAMGWVSEYYAERRPRWTMEVNVSAASLPAYFTTRVELGGGCPDLTEPRA